MGQELIVPDSFKLAKPAQAFAGIDPGADNLADGIGQSYPVIGYRGKVWSLRSRGERHMFIRPDDGTPLSYLDVVIVGQARQKSKSFYEKYDPNQSDGMRPLCWAIDGVVPDPDVPVATKQAASCALCPRNEWKQDPTTGRKGRDCQDYKRLAVLVLPTLTAPLLGGQPLMEAAFLRVPPASLNSLAIMGETMAGQGFTYSAYITRITFDQEKSWPEMIFRPLQPLTDAEAPMILKIRQDPAIKRIVGGDRTGMKEPASIQTIETQKPLQEVQPVASPHFIPAVPTNIVAPSPAISSPVPTESAPLVIDVTLPASGTGLSENGLSGTATPVGKVSSSAKAAIIQTTADTGEPELADADLDARIAGFLKTASV